MRRIAIVVAGILVVAWLVLTLAADPMVARTLSRATGLVFHIGAVDLSLRPVGLVARHVRVSAAPDAPTAIVLSRLTLVPSLRAALRGDTHLRRVRVVNPSIRVRRDAVGEWALIGSPPAPPAEAPRSEERRG